MNHLPSKWISSALAVGLAISPAIAGAYAYAPGDLILYFQKDGGANTVYADLGNAATDFRGTAAGSDAPNKKQFLNVNAALTSAFGSGWATDATIYVGVAGVWGTDKYDTSLQNGDPSRTLYVSRSRDSVGSVGAASSAAWSMNTDGGMTTAALQISQQNNAFANNYPGVQVTVATSDVTTAIQNNNPFLSAGIQGTAFQVFGGGVQQGGYAGNFGTFGDAGPVKFALDLYRILGRTDVAGQVGGVARQGSYEGTVTVDSSGQVSFIAQKPNYSPGDLVLAIQQQGGTNTVYANLGNAATKFRGTAAGVDTLDQVNFLDISAAMTTAFGAGWATDPNIYIGAAGVWGTDQYSSDLQDGDPSRTVYVSRSRVSMGTLGTANSAAWSMNTDGGMTTAAAQIIQQNNAYANNYGTQVAVSPTDVSKIDENNPFLTPGTQGTAFQVFGGGVQQGGMSGNFGNFGAAGSVKFALDLYRILGKTTVAGQVAGNLRSGSFEGTLTLSSSGKVSFITQKPVYSPGDLVLAIQQQGDTNTVYANLGSATSQFRGNSAGVDVANQVNFLDISTALATAFGSGWATDPSIYIGAVGVWGTDQYSTDLQDGDPSRTLYVSRSRVSMGTIGAANSAAWSMNTDGGMTTAAAQITQQNNAYANNYGTQVAVSPTDVSKIDENNPFLTPGTQGTAFQVFGGGVQQGGMAGNFGNFGAAGSVKFALDLYRILGKTSVTGQVAGNLRGGSFEGTLTLSSSGKVSFITQKPVYSPGDLVLAIQQQGGTNTVYANLGSAATQFRGNSAGADLANQVNFLDISATLTSAFGSGWATDPNIYVGAAGVWGTDQYSVDLQDGDPSRTIYVSRSRDSVGTVGTANSAAWSMNTDGGMTTAAAQITQQNNAYANNYGMQVAVSPTDVSKIDENNPFLTPGTQGTAFQVFGGGVQQGGLTGTIGTFGDAGTVKFALDLYRILGKTGVTGQVSGNLRGGSFEGTITINSSGKVSFIAQGPPPSAFDTWMSAFPAISAAGDKLPGANPSGDGMNNLAKFAFGGNPSSGADKGSQLVNTVDANADSVKDFSLTLQVRVGATFTAGPNNTMISNKVDGISYRIEGSTDLVNWTSQVSEVTSLGSGSPKTGYVFKTFRLNAGSGLSGKGFLHAFVTQ